jgi:SAM-dependent methyltransferase
MKLFSPDALGPADRFRAALEDAGYTFETVSGFLQGAPPDTDLPLLMQRASGDSPFEILARIFLLGGAGSLADVERAVKSPLYAQALLQSGLLAGHEGSLRAAAKLVPLHDLLILGDFVRPGEPPAADHVVGVGAASATLSSLTPRRPFGRALDVGTGAGIQALRAAAHCDTVLGTDVNDRALEFARMNAWMNGIGNVEFRKGSFFEPAREEKFDLIVSNPPFVISPENRFVYRDAGASGDGVSQWVVSQAGRYLAPGGVAIVLLNWHHAKETEWPARPLAWMDESGCDRWLICFETGDPLHYAWEWIKSDREAFESAERSLRQWLSYYSELGIGYISAGAAVMIRRENASAWVRADRVPQGKHTGQCGAQIERIAASENYLQSLGSGGQILDARLRLHEDHVLKATLNGSAGAWEWKSLSLAATAGLSFAGQVDTIMMSVLAGCDGTRTAAEAMAVAGISGGPEDDQPREACLGALRQMLRAGFLVPAE